MPSNIFFRFAKKICEVQSKKGHTQNIINFYKKIKGNELLRHPLILKMSVMLFFDIA